MEYISWIVSPCPPPPGQTHSSSAQVSVSLYGAHLSANHSPWDRARAWCYRWRRQLTYAIAAGAAVAVVGSGGSRVAGVVACATAAVAVSASQPLQAVTDDMEAYVAEMVGAGDCTTIGSRPAEDLLDGVDRQLTASAVEWIRKAKLHFGELKDTAADRICAKRWLAEEMKKADMRDKDACGLIPIVVEMLFVPTIDEVLAAKLRRSRVAGVMRAMVGPAKA